MTRVGVVLSAGGSAFFTGMAAAGWDPASVHVVTDRPCGAEARAVAAGLSHRRVTEPDRVALSQALAAEFQGCDAVLLLFSRLVSAVLFDGVPTYNVHPSLLPAYPGLDGVGDAMAAGALFQGATLHRVDAGMDSGPVVAQSVLPVPRQADEARRRHLGYLQSALMVLSFFDLLEAGRLEPGRQGDLPGSAHQNPALIDPRRAQAARDLLAASEAIP